MYMYMYVYISLSLYIYIYIYIKSRSPGGHRARDVPQLARALGAGAPAPGSGAVGSQAGNPNFRGFDSSRFLILRGGIPRSMGNFPVIWNQRFLVCGLTAKLASTAWFQHLILSLSAKLEDPYYTDPPFTSPRVRATRSPAGPQRGFAGTLAATAYDKAVRRLPKRSEAEESCSP